jgi:xanthine dehydrogenase accessory factor
MLTSGEDILRSAQAWSEAGRGIALATVVETWGSAPRPVGSHLVIDAEGNFLGSVSGGCVEGEVVTQGLDALAAGVGRMLEFGVADETAWRAGLSCGGRIRVYVEPMRADWLKPLNEERAARRACALVTDLASGEERLVRAADFAGDPLADILTQKLRRRQSGVAEHQGKELFVAIYAPPLRLIAVGAVHVSQALAPIAKLSGFDMIIIDPRTAFATPERFPDVELLAAWPQDALPSLRLDRSTAVALLTHEPRIDDEGLVLALRADCFYIGALGSKKTHAKRLERLRAEGFGEAELARIHAPIGLDIGAASPAEIAVSIVGEIISAAHGKGAGARMDPV